MGGHTFVGDEIFKSVTIKKRGKATITSVEILGETLEDHGWYKGDPVIPLPPDGKIDGYWQEPFIILP